MDNKTTQQQQMAVAIAAFALLILMGLGIVAVMAGAVTGQGPAYGAAVIGHVTTTLTL